MSKDITEFECGEPNPPFLYEQLYHEENRKLGEAHKEIKQLKETLKQQQWHTALTPPTEPGLYLLSDWIHTGTNSGTWRVLHKVHTFARKDDGNILWTLPELLEDIEALKNFHSGPDKIAYKLIEPINL